MMITFHSAFLRTSVLLLSLVSSSAMAQSIFSDGFEIEPVTYATGGVNYLWFHDTGACVGNSREDFGLLKRYHETDANLGSVRAIAQQQLAAMAQQGMQRLSLGVYFMHQPLAGGTLVDSSNPEEVAQVATNLRHLLADVKAAGFQEVLFRFFPINNINPSDAAFPSHNSSDFTARIDEYWNLIATLRPVLVESGIFYRTDVMVEGAPRDSNPVYISEDERYKYPANEKWSRAVRSLWQRYFAAYGAGDTVGFSTIVDQDNNRLRSRIRHMRYIYEGNYPHVFAIDFYAGDAWDEYQKFLKVDEYMHSQNPPGGQWNTTGWIIAEAFYEDPASAEALHRAIRHTDRTVFYLTQWPLSRRNGCGSTEVNTPPPYQWHVWQRYGF